MTRKSPIIMLIILTLLLSPIEIDSQFPDVQTSKTIYASSYFKVEKSGDSYTIYPVSLKTYMTISSQGFIIFLENGSKFEIHFPSSSTSFDARKKTITCQYEKVAHTFHIIEYQNTSISFYPITRTVKWNITIGSPLDLTRFEFNISKIGNYNMTVTNQSLILPGVVFGRIVAVDADNNTYNFTYKIVNNTLVFESNGDIKNATYPLTIDPFIGFGDSYTYTSSTGDYSDVAKLTSTKIVVSYGSKMRVGTIDGYSITWGNEYSIQADSICALNSTRIIAADIDDDVMYIKLCKVTGTTITVLDEKSFTDTSGSKPSNSRISVDTLEEDKFIIVYIHLPGTYDEWRIRAKVGTVSSDTISLGSTYTAPQHGWAPKLRALSSTKFAIIFKDIYETDDVDRGKCTIGVVSGTSISWGSTVTFNNADTEVYLIDRLSSTKLIVSYWNLSDHNEYFRVAYVPGTYPSFGSAYKYPYVYGLFQYKALCALKSDQAVFIDEHGDACLLNISGTTITFSDEESGGPSDPIASAALTTHKFVVCHRTSSWRGARIGSTAPPQSLINTISPYWHSTDLTITATTTDDGAVENISLYYRYSTDNTTWSDWELYGTDSSQPWEWFFDFPNGNGYYEFYTIVIDKVGLVETKTSADEDAGYETTKPTSSVNPITPYWHNEIITITATATDTFSGLSTVKLFYRFSSDNSTWSDWALFGTDTEYPWRWSFNFPSGEGYYQFYTIATDKAGNTESKTTADEIVGYDTTLPTSSTSPITPYWQNQSVDITASASDNLELKHVSLYYRFSMDNSTWSEWTLYGTDTDGSDGWNWTFDFPDGMGYYQFYSIATDKAGNTESKTTADIELGKPIPCYFTYSPQEPINGQVASFVDKSAISTYTKWFINGKLVAETMYLTGSHPPFNLTYTFNISNIYNITLWVYNETFDVSNTYTVNLPVKRNLTLDLSPNHIGINYIAYHLNTTTNASALMDLLNLNRGEWIHKFNETTHKWMSLWKYNDTVKLGDNFDIHPWDVVVVVVSNNRTIAIDITEKVNTTQTKTLQKGYHYLSWSGNTPILSCDVTDIGLQEGDWVFKYDLKNETWLSYNVGLSGDIFEIKPYDCIFVGLSKIRVINIG